MASALPFPPKSSVLHSTSVKEAHGRSRSSVVSASSSGTVRQNRPRSISTSSLSSVGSYFLSSFRTRENENSFSTPPRSVSSINLNKVRSQDDRCSTSAAASRRSSLASALSRRLTSESVATLDRYEIRLGELAENGIELSRKSTELSRAEVDFDRGDPDLEDEQNDKLHLDTPIVDQTSPPRVLQSLEGPAFRRWVSKLRRRRQHSLGLTTQRGERRALDDFIGQPSSAYKPRRSAHVKSDSGNSSLRFVTAMRSATATLASVSVAGLSRRTSNQRHRQLRSSLISDRNPRPSVESVRSVTDEVARQRSRKRREKLEELIRTEESYVADIKALSDAYLTILGHQPTSTSFARGSAQKTMAGILQLHEDILGSLYRVVPFSEYDQTITRAPDAAHSRSHARWHSVDAVPQRHTPKRAVLATIRQSRRSLNISRSSEDDSAAAILRCDADVVAAVTMVFADRLAQFVAYEDYGANYDLVQQDLDETQRSIDVWSHYDKAIEALSVLVNPVRSREANRKKAMTVKDLLIKPIQRIPRYELLFQDLCKLTPVCDDPEAHASVRELCDKLNSVCQRMNRAKDNPNRARALEKTWLIGDRLSFGSQVPQAVYLRLLGQMSLCGCLYIAYRGKERVKGQYAICMLFESTLLLATAEEDQPKYFILVGIPLANAIVQETDNLKGLQCHTAPHAWKVVFEHSARMFELIFVACSAIEAEVWRSHFTLGHEYQAQAVAEGKANPFELQSPLTSQMKSIGKAFGKPGSFVRHMSVHRAATVGPTTDLNQVVIKNTQAMEEAQEGSSQASLQNPRSQSVQGPSHVQTLAPHRAERHRIEALLTDVWTKDLLPFPGMVRRSDPIRDSANHVIRKFSIASITSNFSASKRTASYTSVSSSRKEDVVSVAGRSSHRDSRASYPARQPLVNFHNAPSAFLPIDFEVQDPAAKRKRSAFRTFTMTMERPFSPLLGNDNKPTGLRRAQSVRDVADGTSAPKPSYTMLPPEKPKEKEDRTPAIAPAYSVVQERPKTPASAQMSKGKVNTAGHAKTPRKSKSGMLKRLFG